MLSYCLKFRKNTEIQNLKVVGTKTGKIIKTRIINNQCVIVIKQNLSNNKKLVDC